MMCSAPDRGALGRAAVALLSVHRNRLAAFFFLVSRRVLAISQMPSWPPAAGAITVAGAEQAVRAFAAR